MRKCSDLRDYCEKYSALMLVGILLQSEKLCDEGRTGIATDLLEIVSDGDRMKTCMEQQPLEEHPELEGKVLERKT